MTTNKLQPVRGTKDSWGEDQLKASYVQETARNIAALYGYQTLATPIFEFTEVFKRTLGDVSDIVTKEMYSFEDRGGESLTLRPEFTAGVARAFISGGMTQHLPLKFFSTGPLFRYERPQKGRYRQFHQINMECLGVASPKIDSEVISMGAHILQTLGILDQTILQLNSLGDIESRTAYRTALVDYLQDYREKLSDDSRIRLEKNPMRILDSKDVGDREIIAGAPVINGYFTAHAEDFFAEVKEGLDGLGIAYNVNPYLVRGLDYYCHTAFEFTTLDTRAQNTVLAGGRYDGLIGMMGGPETPAIGFAAGVERLCDLLTTMPAKKRAVALIPLGEHAEKIAEKLASELRHQGIAIMLEFSGNAAKRMKKAHKLGAKAAIFLGEDELNKGVVKLRDLDSGEEREIRPEALVDSLAIMERG